MTFLFPAFLYAAGAVSAAVVILHFIVTREPKTVPLPTTRFAPDRAVRAQSRAIQPQDLLLMLLRILLIMAIGAALAHPILRPPKRALARLVLADRSRAVASGAEVIDSARSLLSSGDALVLFDSSAVAVRDKVTDSLSALTPTSRIGRVSAAIIAAMRTAAIMRESADSFELAIVSPLTAEEMDQATDSVRALWPGAVRLVRVAARVDSVSRTVPAFDGAADDPMRLAMPQGRSVGEPSSRLVRQALTAADSAWVQGGTRVLVYWPTHGTVGSTPLPTPWVAATPDTVGAVSAGEVVVVAPMERYATVHDLPTGAHVFARWVDGTPAALETKQGSGCLRTVAIGVPSRGDLVLQPRFAQFIATLTAPCGATALSTPLDSTRLVGLKGPTKLGLASARSIMPPDTIPSPWVKWLLLAAAVFAAGELLLRRRSAAATRVEAA